MIHLEEFITVNENILMTYNLFLNELRNMGLKDYCYLVDILRMLRLVQSYVNFRQIITLLQDVTLAEQQRLLEILKSINQIQKVLLTQQKIKAEQQLLENVGQTMTDSTMLTKKLNLLFSPSILIQLKNIHYQCIYILELVKKIL